MRSSSINNSPPPRLSQNLGTILTVGFGASIAIHLGLFVAISRWWQPPRSTQEPIEITLVEPVAPPAPVSHPPAAISTQPIPLPKPKVLAPAPKPIPISTPVIQSSSKLPTSSPAKPAPKPIESQAKSKPKPIAPKRRVKAIRVAVTPSSKPISPPPFNPPFPPEPSPAIATKPLPKPAPPQVRVKSPPTPTPVNPPVPIDRPTPTEIDGSIASNPTPQPVLTPTPVKKSLQPTPAPPTPSPAVTPSNPLPILDRASPSPNLTTSPASAISQPLASDRPNSLGGENSTQRRAAGGGSPENGGQIDRPNIGGNPQGNLAAPTGSSSATSNTGGTQNGSSTGNNASAGGANMTGSGTSGLQCVRNCQIARLQDLQASDGGKDRLRIRIVIDANGVVSAAEIAKSSGNPEIDTVVLDGIKQMQFNPSGKTIKGIIKANILLWY